MAPLKAKNNYFFAIGVVFSLYREPLMGDPFFLSALQRLYASTIQDIRLP